MARTVWILGSGFSKSLGGPLLNDLLSDRSGTEARYRLTELANSLSRSERLLGDLQPEELKRRFNFVYEIFSDHLRGAETSKGKAVHWDHAEDFLTFVDSTETNEPRRALLKSWLPADRRDDIDIQVFRSRTVQAIAAECHFLQTASVKEDESWRPYIRWAGELDPQKDAIITFNYDLVLETLGAGSPSARTNDKGVLTPQKPNAETGYVPIYKLHGSVNWFIHHDGTPIVDADFYKASLIGNRRPLIGTPGTSKRTVRDKYLEPIWQEANKALTEAEVIVFLGYRSPPSDPDARQFILDAISTPEGIEHAPRHRRVHLVLGPNTNDPAVTRMEKLIEFSMQPHGRVKRHTLGYSPKQAKYEVLKQPLYVEDFLSAYSESELCGTDPADD